MDQTTNKSLGKSFKSTIKGYDKLKTVLSAPLSNQLMQGMGGLSGINAMIQQTQNLHNMGKANRMEVIAQQEQIVASSKKNVEVAAAEVAKLEASGKLQTKKGQKAADNLHNAVKEEQQQVKILDNLRFMNREIDIKNGKMKEAALISAQFTQKLLGTAGTLIKNSEFFMNSIGMMIHSDNFTYMKLNNLVKAHQNRPKNCLITMLTFSTNNPKSCGIVEVDKKGIVKAFHEKIDNPPGNVANGAIYIFENDLLEWLKTNHPHAKDFSTQVLPFLIGKIFTYHTTMSYIDIGNINALEEARSFKNIKTYREK